jgi:hypothetical protein
MRVIDIDPELLRRSANAARHASDQGIRHVGFEIEGDVEKILTTLAPQGPYGFTVRPKMLPDGTLKIQVQTKFEDIRAEYQITRDMCDVHSHTPARRLVSVPGSCEYGLPAGQRPDQHQ